MRAATVATALAAAMLPGLAQARTIAEDVADVSTRACFGMAAGKLTPPRNIAEEEQLFKGLDLQQGMPNGVLEQLGQGGTTMVSRATLASRTNGTQHVILAANGAVPGCRVMLVGEADPRLADAVGAAIGSPAYGWRALPAYTATRGAVERRLFLRFDESKRPFIMNLMILRPPEKGLQLFTSVAAAPPELIPPELRPKP